LFMKYLRRGSGYYIDIGASQLIIDGKIKLVGGQIQEISRDCVHLDNELNARTIFPRRHTAGFNSPERRASTA
jgi:hypothetical protein